MGLQLNNFFQQCERGRQTGKKGFSSTGNIDTKKVNSSPFVHKRLYVAPVPSSILTVFVQDVNRRMAIDDYENGHITSLFL